MPVSTFVAVTVVMRRAHAVHVVLQRVSRILEQRIMHSSAYHAYELVPADLECYARVSQRGCVVVVGGERKKQAAGDETLQNVAGVHAHLKQHQRYLNRTPMRQWIM